MFVRIAALFAVLLLVACADDDDQANAQLPDPPASSTGIASVPPQGWHAMLVAGDNSSPAFNNGIDTLRERLTALGVQHIRSFSAVVARGQEIASAPNISEGLRHVGGAACFVYVTSHGNESGFFLRVGDRIFTPTTFDQALNEGCGAVPTVVVVSACHSGTFITLQMRRPNRIILAAAAKSRTSFGCGADDDYTYYDQCFLQQLDQSVTWRDVALYTRACVETLERRLGVPQESHPQMFFGAEVANLRLPGR
jgi:hypothetical protein